MCRGEGIDETLILLGPIYHLSNLHPGHPAGRRSLHVLPTQKSGFPTEISRDFSSFLFLLVARSIGGFYGLLEASIRSRLHYAALCSSIQFSKFYSPNSQCIPFLGLVQLPQIPEFVTIQKEDFPSHQTCDTCMEYYMLTKSKTNCTVWLYFARRTF